MSSPDNNFAREVIEVPVAEELGESFLAYSLSVITSRAIPDVRDGLKPVQRRILYSMLRMGLRPDRPHRKCAHVVGDVMGKFHPHGDSAIYDTLVRLGQDFGRNVTLVDPQGNFGSLDDPPAAQRYTECRLTDAALDLLGEIDEETVEYGPTYDGENSEPRFLPGLLPNLLINGTSGIAVGMATNMAPHNLGEVYEAIKLVMTKRRPKPTLEELMAVLPGPDLPMGAIVVDEDLREAYETGRGSFRIRAKATIFEVTKARQGIEITELPYMVGVERVVAKVTELVRAEKLTGIHDIKNLSDRHHGTKLVIECKSGVSAELLLQKLYKMTPLEDTFSINNTVLVNGVPTVVGLYDLCQHYITHRLDVVVRRTEYRLAKAEARLHVLEGYLIAIDNIDEVVQIIRTSANTPVARQRLMEALELTEIQAQHILDMQLKRISQLARDEVVDEVSELRTEIADLKKILGSEQRRRTIVIRELGELVKKYGRPRRSVIVPASSIPDIEHVAEQVVADITDDPCVVSLATSGVVGREPAGSSKSFSPSRHDVIQSVVVTTMKTPVLLVMDSGRILRVNALDIPEVGGRSRGKDTTDVFGSDRGEQPLALLNPTGGPVVLVTAQGVVKRLERDAVSDLRPGRTIISLGERDRVVACFEVDAAADIVMLTTDAQALRTPIAGVRPQGAGAKGVSGMALKGTAKVVGAGVASDDAVILTVSDTGSAKSTSVEEIPTKGRNGGGVRLTKFSGEKRLDYAWVGNPERIVAVVGTDGSTKPASTPESIGLKPTRRDGASRSLPHRILQIGTLRW
ncbi:MAG: DNA topoisomerase 4 subunit A [Acidimicrobiales bacterium]|nr:DNA topoisomerase 4 subunit A [Acidimicrobiales bacterium]